MFFIGLLAWWYGPGWQGLTRSLIYSLTGTLDFFSVGLLFRTLLSPFKQISVVGRVQGTAMMQLSAWVDLQISRVIGALIRLSVIGFGLCSALLLAIVALVLLATWPLLPLFPLVAVLLGVGGWL